MEQKKAVNIFEQESFRKTYFTLAVPVTMGMLFSVVYNIADTYFIARTQNTGLVAGVSLCAPVFTFLMAFGNIFGQGGTSLLSRLFGKKDMEGTKRVSSFCFYAAIATGAVLGLLMLLLHRPLLFLLGADKETYQYALPYYMTLAAGAPLVVLNYIHMNLLRAEGMSKESMAGNITGLVVNIILDPIFISGFGWGSFGAALATVIGYTVSVVIWAVIVKKKSRILSMDPKICLIPAGEMTEIFTIGFSAALTNITTSICMIVTNQYLLPYGNDQIAALGVALKVSMVINLVLVGMSFGAAPMIGYYYGGRKYEDLKRFLRFLFTLVGGTAVVMTAVLFVLSDFAIGLFLKEPALISAGSYMLRWHIVTMAVAAGVLIITICFQAMGKAKEALLVSVCRQGIVYIVVIVVLAKLAGYHGIAAAQAAADILTLVLTGWLFLKRILSELQTRP